VWIGFILFWLIIGLGASRAVKKQSLWGRALTIVAGATPFLLLFADNLRWGPLAWRVVPQEGFVLAAGVALTYCGLVLAAWARVLLGRHWSGTVTIKKDHQLIRNGPYAVVRHPIYSGLILALFGTALVEGEARGLAAVAIAFVVFSHKLRLEEQFMIERFGDEYKDYRKHTRALVPFIL